MTQVRPLNDLVIVKVDPPEKKVGSLLLPNPEHAPMRKGTVLRVGPGRRKLKRRGKKDTVYTPTQVKPGDRIVFFAAATGTKQGKQLAYSLPDDEDMIREEDILFVFEGDLKVDV